MKPVNRKELLTEDEPQNGYRHSPVENVNAKEKDVAKESRVPPLIIHNQFPNLTITPVTSRLEARLKSPTEGSLKFSIRYSDIIPPKESSSKPKATPSLSPLDDAKSVDPLLSLPKGLTILPVVTGPELTPTPRSLPKDNVESSVSVLPAVTLREIPIIKPTNDLPQTSKSDPIIDKTVTEHSVDSLKTDVPLDLVIKVPVGENRQCTSLTNSRILVTSGEQTATVASTQCIPLTPTPKDALTPSSVDIQTKTILNNDNINHQETKSSADLSNLKTHIPDNLVTQERKSETTQQPPSCPLPLITNSVEQTTSKDTSVKVKCATESKPPQLEVPQVSVIKRKARLKISPRLSDSQRNQRLARFAYEVEPQLDYQLDNVEKADKSTNNFARKITIKITNNVPSQGNNENKAPTNHFPQYSCRTTKTFPKCVVQLTRLPAKVEKVFLEVAKSEKRKGEDLSKLHTKEEEKQKQGPSPKKNEGKNRGRSTSKKRKVMLENDAPPPQGGKILRIRNGDEVMCTKVMNKTVEPSEKTRCTFCGKLTQSTNVWRHLLAVYKVKADIDEVIEDEEMDEFKCTICGANLCSKAALGIHSHHLHTKTNQYECKCPCCSETFLTDVSLACHMVTHYRDILKERKLTLPENEKPPKIMHCGLCCKSFMSLEALESHLEAHGGNVKSNQCKVCLKIFSKSYQLKCHMVVHTELRPFKCEQCGKTFRFKSSLRSHNYFHIGVQPYKCKVCDKGFFESGNMMKHMRNIHREECGILIKAKEDQTEKKVKRIRIVKVKTSKQTTSSKETSSSDNINDQNTDSDSLKSILNEAVKNTFKIILSKKQGSINKEKNKIPVEGGGQLQTTVEESSKNVIKPIRPRSDSEPTVEFQSRVVKQNTVVIDVVSKNDVGIYQEQVSSTAEQVNFSSRNVPCIELQHNVQSVPKRTNAISDSQPSSASSVGNCIISSPEIHHQQSSALAQLEHLSRTMLQVREPRQNSPQDLYQNLLMGNSYHQPKNQPPYPSDKQQEHNSMLFHLLTTTGNSAAAPERNGVINFAPGNIVWANGYNEEFKQPTLRDWTESSSSTKNLRNSQAMPVILKCVLCDAMYVTTSEMADHLLYYHRVSTGKVNTIIKSYCT